MTHERDEHDGESETPPPGWPDLLTRLDRHGLSRLPSPDITGLAELMRLYQVPGVGVAVGQVGRAPWTAGFGEIAAGEQTPVGPHTAFQACSISKHVAALGALRLVDDGALELDADVNDYLRSWRLPDSDGWPVRVTLRQLLAHTAGLSYNWFRGFAADSPKPTIGQVLRGEPPANTPPVRASLLPGSRSRYSGSHYAVVQRLMTDATGTPFDDLMRLLVLEPVGMADSSYSQAFPDRRPDSVAAGHQVDGSMVAGRWREIPEMAGAGLWTTPADLVRFELEIIRAAAGESALLPGELAGQMLTPQIPDGYGLGTQVDEADGQRRFGHTGASIGYSCFSFAWPGAATAVVVMANASGCRELLDSIVAAAERLYRPTQERDPLPTDAVVGRYQLREGYQLDITSADGRLTLAAPGQPAARLLRSSAGRYRVAGLDCELHFRRADDRGTVLEIWQEDQGTTVTRDPRPPAYDDR